MNKIRTLITLMWVLLCLTLAGAAPQSPALSEQSKGLEFDSVRYWAIQQGGRVKPFDTFARELVRSVTGKEAFEGADPVFTVLYWWAHGSKDANPATEDLKIIEIRNLEFKKQLNLAAEERWFSVKELEANTTYQAQQQELRNLPPKGKIPERFAVLTEVVTKIHSVKEVSHGQALSILPAPSKIDDPWIVLGDLPDSVPEAGSDSKMDAKGRDLLGHLLGMRQSVLNNDGAKFKSSAEGTYQIVSKLGPYPSYSELAREVHYNHFRPFRKAWMCYLLSLVLMFLAFNSQGRLYWLGMLAASSGLGLHIYGFYLRCTIAGRPPVTNMYESVIWVAFGAVLFSLIFEFKHRARSYLLSSSAAAVVCLVLADTLPAVLDPSIRPLTPVLRSNFWLTIHVLTITLGYAAFLLSLGIGHMVLWRYAFQSDQKETVSSLNKALYKSLQVGVLLLAAGTILGGVWANSSWGRFWGWDPKEVWALIALLGYLAILHGRYAGWLGHFGTAAWSVLAFQGVLMAWYGVNFVLGAGLHSYGFGNGGVEYVSIFTGAELLFVLALTAKYKKLGNRA